MTSEAILWITGLIEVGLLLSGGNAVSKQANAPAPKPRKMAAKFKREDQEYLLEHLRKYQDAIITFNAAIKLRGCGVDVMVKRHLADIHQLITDTTINEKEV